MVCEGSRGFGSEALMLVGCEMTIVSYIIYPTCYNFIGKRKLDKIRVIG